MSTACINQKDSLKLFSEIGITSEDRVPAVVIQELAKNPAWVVSAVNQLKDIDFHLQNKEIDQQKKITDNINNVISCLQTLDICRLQLQEELEKEAITTFGLHHTIKNLPSSIKLEIAAAVKAAHAQNETDIEDKTAILSELEDKICTLREEQLKLEKDNNALLPQRNLIRKQHDSLVTNLNKLLEEKSRILITMNETREKILKHNQEIVETEIKIQKLKAALSEEQDEANKKIEGYKRDIAKVTKKKELWENKNIRVSQELNAVNTDLTEHKMALQELQNEEKLQDKAVLELKKENQNLKLKIDGEKSAQANYANTKKKLTETLAKIRKKSENSFNEKKKIADEIKLRVDYETKRNKELQESEEEQQKAIVECTDAEMKAKKEVEGVEAKLQSHQLEFSEYTENLANLDLENTQNKDAIQKMSENHSLTVAQFNREIVKRKNNLKEEKQLRLDTQKERDSLTKLLRVTEEQQIKYSSQMNQKISKLKAQFAEKSTGGRELQKEVQEKNQTLQKLDEETKTMKETLKNLADEKEELVKRTKNTIENLEETIKDRTKILEEKTPLFEEVERKYQEQSKVYQQCKEAFSTQRRNETSLKKELHQAEKDVEEIKGMQEKNQKKIKISQDNYLSILNSNSEESKLLEEEIYVQSCKLKSVIEENHTLKKNKDELEREIVNTEEGIESGKTLQEKIIEELVETRDKLTNSFKERTTMEEMLNCRDTEMMDQMTGVLNILNYNSQQVNCVAEQLFKQLEGLGVYLDKVRHKRTH